MDHGFYIQIWDLLDFILIKQYQCRGKNVCWVFPPYHRQCTGKHVMLCILNQFFSKDSKIIIIEEIIDIFYTNNCYSKIFIDQKD